MKEIIDLMSAIQSDVMKDYEVRKLGKDSVGGLTVSTCYTTDMGYETAILDERGAHPVERYESKTEAERGHAKWLKFAGNRKNKKIMKLGYGSLVEPEEVELEREEGE